MLVSRFEWTCDGCQSSYVTDEEQPAPHWTGAIGSIGETAISLDLCQACSATSRETVDRWNEAHRKNREMDEEFDTPTERESDWEKRDELERRDLHVHVTRHVTNESPDHYFCQIRNAQIDQGFYGDTKGTALIHAIESLSASITAGSCNVADEVVLRIIKVREPLLESAG